MVAAPKMECGNWETGQSCSPLMERGRRDGSPQPWHTLFYNTAQFMLLLTLSSSLTVCVSLFSRSSSVCEKVEHVCK